MNERKDLMFRDARMGDLTRIVHLLADDPLGAGRERPTAPLPAAYHEALAAIDADPNNRVLTMWRDKDLLGVLQLTYLPNLTHAGRWRAQIEGVRVARTARGEGLGKRLVLRAIEEARHRDCHLVQLTTDKTRPEALRFYESLGFQASHEGMKLRLASEG